MSNVRLYQFQEEGLRLTQTRRKVAYYWEMGTGKTFVGAEKLYSLSMPLNIIVCQKSKIDDWVNHFSINYPALMEVYNLTDNKIYEKFLADSTLKDRIRIGVINYELIWRRKELLRLSSFTLMLDESSLIQNSKAKRSKFILKLNFKNVILLSGTPCSGKYENLWSQMHLLGWNIPEELFLSQYVNYKLIRVGKAFHKVVDIDNPYKNVERLKGKLREYGANFLKTEECFDLPEQNFIDVKTDTPKEYYTFMRDSIVDIDDYTFIGNNTLTKRLRARQILAYCNPSKLEALEDLINSTNDRIIVFYNFNEELSHISQICKGADKPLSHINGAVKDLKNYERHSNSITLVQYQAGAKGLNLQKSNRLIFYSPTEKCEDYMQAIKRIHRIGQDKPCFYYRLISNNSIEEKIYSALERGVDYTDSLFKEDFKC